MRDKETRNGYNDAVGEVHDTFRSTVEQLHSRDSGALLAAGLVIKDLVMQGWSLRIRQGFPQVKPPDVKDDHADEKQRIREQELVRRDAQLSEPAVQEFIRSMEHTRLHDGRFVSIFSVMRDGRELADSLRKARLQHSHTETLSCAIDPYLQFVSEGATCSFTGLRLMDMWRYFRHTWTNQYVSVPGRTMMFIVRDRAATYHPVIGIGSLSSPIVQIRERDRWIGWDPESLLAEMKAQPTNEMASWLVHIVDRAIDDIYTDDFLEDGLLSARQLGSPTEDVVRRLLDEAGEQRRLHYRFARSQDHKQARANGSGPDHWTRKARTHLFRSKRAQTLATLLHARELFIHSFGKCPTGDKLRKLTCTAIGGSTIRKVVRKAKADRIGIAVADISVCGAVQPYNAILGGKLVAMLTTSPEVVMEYKRRYLLAESEIASSIAGRPVVRPSTLVLLGTTSLYGVGSSQYNRVMIPCELIGGCASDVIRFRELGRSESFGTSQYSDETVQALVGLVQQSANGQRVNSIFGEGVSPKLRKVREGLDLLDLPTDALLRHHRHRVLYAVSLIKNLKRYLLGMDTEPDYFVPIEKGSEATSLIANWWRERWLKHRINSDAVLQGLSQHTLVRPIRHGARVQSPATGSNDM